MARLNNSEFLSQITDVLTKNNGDSSVYITQKRLTPALPLDDTPINDLPSNVVKHTEEFPKNEQQYPVLIRIAMNGTKSRKTKLSTVVETDNLDQFWSDYAQILKKGFVGLKKKEKRKTKKSKVSK